MFYIPHFSKGKEKNLIFLVSARENGGTEIRDWSKVMLKSLLVCPWLADSSLSRSGSILACATPLALLSHCQRGKGQLFKGSNHVLAKQRGCFLRAGGRPSGTAAGGEGASPGQPHHLKLGRQRSSSFLLGSPHTALSPSLVVLFQDICF